MPLTQVDQGLLGQYAQYTGFKNRIINGAMTFAQRATTFSGVGGSAYQTLDRFVLDTRINGSPTGSYTQAQSTDAPAGFNNSFSVTVSTAGNSLASSGALQWNQFIEGYNVADFAWGTASAQPVTISFWVKASITGVYSFGVVNAGYDRSYVANYTVNSANTWEYKTITIPGCPDGTWNTTTGRGIQLRFSLGTGSNYVTSSPNTWLTAEYEQSSTASASAAFWSTTGATWRITGVQLEKGSTATSFDYRPYGTELALCQRYCAAYYSGGIYQRFGTGFNFSTTGNTSMFNLPVEMRTQPSLTTGSTASHFAINHGSDSITACSVVPSLSTAGSNSKTVTLTGTVASGLTAGGGGMLISNNGAPAYMIFSAEL